MPRKIVVFSALALLGSVGLRLGAQTSPALLGALAGLLSAVLTALLMIAYHTHPDPRR